MPPDTKWYRFIGTFSADQRFDQVQFDADPEKDVLKLKGDPKQLTEDQHAKLSQFIVMEEVPAKEAEAIEPKVDQPGPFGPSTSTASEPVSGSTPDIGALSFDDKKKLAKDLNIEGRAGKNEEELTALLLDYYNPPTTEAVS